MAVDPVVQALEGELAALADSMTRVRDDECLLCYVYRMLDHGCTGLMWARRYRDLRAPRATALEKRLGRVGGFCDCEIFLNGYELAAEHWVVPDPAVRPPYVAEGEPCYPDPMPACTGVPRGSTQECRLWVPIRRRW